MAQGPDIEQALRYEKKNSDYLFLSVFISILFESIGKTRV
jgi:hypothetical protein